MNIGVVRFLGTNCDRDIWKSVKQGGHTPQWLDFRDGFEVKDIDAIILPGGFSYGDYLRSGALAANAPVMKSVKDFADAGKPVLGICNGFQILCETGLLPGALIKNKGLKFIDQWVELEQVGQAPHWGSVKPRKISLPIAHGEGQYYVKEDQLKSIEDQGQVWFRYKNDVNGSLNLIAGVMNKERNVYGMMPHPERAIKSWMGGSDGCSFFEGI